MRGVAGDSGLPDGMPNQGIISGINPERFPRIRIPEKDPGRAGTMKNEMLQRGRETAGRKENDEVKLLLLNKYRKIFVDKLSGSDLLELQDSLRHQFTGNREINMAYKARFEEKLREYFHEEILRREIVSIEVLVNRLLPGDLKKP